MTTAAQVLAQGQTERAFTFSDAKNPAGVHVAVGYKPWQIMKLDPDTGKWVYVTEHLGMQLTDIVWSETHGMFFAIGYGRTVFRSSNGTTWEAIPNALSERNWINLCISPGGKMIAVASDGFVAQSVGGVTWTEANAGLPIQSVGFINAFNQFAILGPVVDPKVDTTPIVLVSSDGDTWVQSPTA